MKNKPDLGFWKLWNLSFGFFGVQIAYALQSANVSRIFATLGADPHDLSYFWILPPLMGLIVQPLVGTYSDRTWTRIGRRLPYLIVGAVVAVLVMCLLPNAGSFGLAVSSAIIVGLIALMLLDTSINMAMQPFKMLVGDMVNEKQKGLAYSIQSFLCNAGSIVGFIFPFFLTWIGLKNTAEAGVIPQTVIYSFYIGAAILLGCVIYTMVKVKEWPPEVYNEYNGGVKAEEGKKENFIQLLKKAPSTFWTVGIVQFFCWFAFLFMWTYTNGTVAKNAFGTPETYTVDGYQNDSEAYTAKYIALGDSTLVIEKGKILVAGVQLNGEYRAVKNLVVGNDTVVLNSKIFSVKGETKYIMGQDYSTNGATVLADGVVVDSIAEFCVKDYLSQMNGETELLLVGIYTHDPKTGELFLDEVEKVTVSDASSLGYKTHVVLNTESDQYNDAGNWVGILFAVQAIGSVLWAVVLPMFRNRKFSYSLSLLLGAAGFITAGMFTDQYMLFISFALIGCAWAAMLAWPFTILTNSLKGGNIGAYLGLFNCSICIPQIVGALVGGRILGLFGEEGELAPEYMMMIVAGISLIIGAVCVVFIKEHKPEDDAVKA